MAPSRAFGVVRVSRAKDDARSPGDQRARIEAACETAGLELVGVTEELDVSGGAPLAKRPGLLHAVEAVEQGAADVVVVAYFDRLIRSLNVQQQVVDRVEAAGGELLTLDFGKLSNGTAMQRLQGNVIGAFAEYHRYATAERTRDAKRDAVARGVAPFARIPPGIRRGVGRVLEQDPDLAPVMREAFELRAGGATISEVRQFIADHGVTISHTGLQKALGSRLYIGELHFGQWSNLEALEPIVDADLFRRVQSTRVSKGRYAKSERLLARLGVLVCSGCGGRMVVGTRRYQTKRSPDETSFYQYRCMSPACPRRVSIAAPLAEQVVADATKTVLATAHGEASTADQLVQAQAQVDRAEAERDAQVAALAGIPGDAVRAKLLEAQAAVDLAADNLEQLRRAAGPTLTVTVADWDSFTVEHQRRLIRLAISSAVVSPGRGGATRIVVTSATGGLVEQLTGDPV